MGKRDRGGLKQQSTDGNTPQRAKAASLRSGRAARLVPRVVGGDDGRPDGRALDNNDNTHNPPSLFSPCSTRLSVSTHGSPIKKTGKDRKRGSSASTLHLHPTLLLDSDRPSKRRKGNGTSSWILDSSMGDMSASSTTKSNGSSASTAANASSTTPTAAGSWILGSGQAAASSISAPTRSNTVAQLNPDEKGQHEKSHSTSLPNRLPGHPSLPPKPPALAPRSPATTISHPSLPPTPLSPTFSARSAVSSASSLQLPELPTSHVTSSGIVLNLQNAGFILSAYLQSYGRDPSSFKSTATFTLVPSPVAPVRAGPPKTHRPRETHQPPPDHLYHCTITLPHPCPLKSMTSPPPGLRSKDLAKKHAQMEMVRKLLEMKEIGEDLRPLNRTVGKAKAYERVAEHVVRKTRDSFSPQNVEDPNKAAKINNFKKAMFDRLPSLTPGTQVIPGISDYPYIPRAGFWDLCGPLRSNNLWPTVFQLRLGGDFADRTGECRTVCLLTSRPLPVFGDDGEAVLDLTVANAGPAQTTVPASVRLIRARKMKEWEEGKLEQAMEYTLRLIRAHINKPAHGDLVRSKWLVVPMLPDWSASEKVRRRDISWDEIERATSGPLWTPFSFDDDVKLEGEIVDAMTTPKYEFSRRLFVRRLRRDVSAKSPHPDDPSQTILDMFPSPVELTRPDQPMIEGDQVNTIRHGGFIAGLPNSRLLGKYAIPEVTHRHCIAASVFRTTSAIPSALAALDDLLVARDFSDAIFHSRLDTTLALSALSCPTTHNHKGSKSYERLEMLGDTLLKLLVAVYLLFRDREDEIDWDEVHREKQIMVSNRTLQSHAIKAGVVPYIRGANMKSREWLPMGWMPLMNPPNEEKRREKEEAARADAGSERVRLMGLHMDPTRGDAEAAQNGIVDSGRTHAHLVESNGGPEGGDKPDTTSPETGTPTSDSIGLKRTTHEPHPDRYENHEWSTKKLKTTDPPPTTQQLGDKTIADVSEALVAAGYLSENRNIDGAISAMHIIGMKLSRFKDWDAVQLVSKAKNEVLQLMEKGAMPIKVLGYQFAVSANGRDALTLSQEPMRRARLLKFKALGDAVIDYFLIGWLYDNHPKEGPGSLTVMRHSRHSDTCLAAYAVSSGIIDLITDIPGELMGSVTQYKKAIQAAERNVAGVEGMARWEFWADVKSLSYVADSINALFGAILVDTNYDLAQTRQVFETNMLPWLERHCVGPGQSGPHPRTVWSEMIYKRGCREWKLEKFELGQRDWRAVIRLHETPIGRGESEAPTLAVRRACEEAVKRCKEEKLLDRVCDCPRKAKKGKVEVV